MEEFKVGDVVQLKSGGPHMTVSGFDTENYDEAVVITIWFEKNKREGSAFSPATLKKVPEA